MQPDAQEEARLIDRLRAGDNECFHTLIRPYERKVYLTALSVLHSEADAEDAAQEAIIKAYRNISGFRGDSRFGTWLIAITLNEARGRLRRAGRTPHESLDQARESPDGEVLPALLVDWREIPSEALERQELCATLRAAVGDLPPIYREVFTLRDLEELNVQETAEALGVTTNVVKVRLHRARMMLQKALAPTLKSRNGTRRGIFGRMLWS